MRLLRKRYFSAHVPWKTGLFQRLVIWVSVFCCVAGSLDRLRAEVYDQNQVKAVFLYNLTNFITWPASVNPDDQVPFIIAIMGNDDLGGYLDQVVSGETVDERPIHILRLSSLDQLYTVTCDLLYIATDQMPLWPQIREIVHTRHTLTVSDVNGFSARGGMITLTTVGRKIRIEINVKEARRKRFEISSKLLKLAHIVSDDKEAP